MSWLQRAGWAALAILTLATAIGIFLVRLPDPEGAVAINRAVYQADNEPAALVTLPHLMLPRLKEPVERARYRMQLDLPAAPAESLLLYIPTLNRQISVDLNGETIFHSGARTLWSGPLIGATVLLHLPRQALKTGGNELVVTLDVGRFTLPSYLSRLYVGTEEEVAPNYKLRTFLEDQLKTMALAAHVLLGLGIICTYFYRPKDTLFAWLAAMVVVSFVLSIGMFVGFQPGFHELLPYLSVLSPTIGFLMVGVSLAIIGRKPPSVLRYLCIGVPLLGGLIAVVGASRPRLSSRWSVFQFC